jgi:hypothetical protein
MSCYTNRYSLSRIKTCRILLLIFNVKCFNITVSLVLSLRRAIQSPLIDVELSDAINE